MSFCGEEDPHAFLLKLLAPISRPAPSGTDMPLNYLDGQNKFQIAVDAELEVSEGSPRRD
jgi:hypothetical protein